MNTEKLAELIDKKRREIEASGLAQWSYAKPEEIKDCPSCGAGMELVKASEGGMINEPYFPTHPIRGAALPRRTRPATFFACPACEHCEER
jgi:hypothetical protein